MDLRISFFLYEHARERAFLAYKAYIQNMTFQNCNRKLDANKHISSGIKLCSYFPGRLLLPDDFFYEPYGNNKQDVRK